MAVDGAGGGMGSGSSGSAPPPPPASSRTPIVFVTDAAAEGSRIADTLRTSGYAVVDVPLSMLVSRAQAQRPHVVLVDVDAAGALDEIARLRRLPGGGAIDFVYFGVGDGVIRNADDAVANEGSAFFVRPIDIAALARRVESLTGGPVLHPHSAEPRSPSPPKRIGSAPPERPSNPSLPAPGLRTPGPPLPMSTPSLADLVDPPRSLATFGTVSSELQQLLADAELRADGIGLGMGSSSASGGISPLQHGPEAPIPTPEEEIETVLPADVLASLDEPLEGDEDEEQDGRAGMDRDGVHSMMGAHAKGTTAGGSKQTTASGRSSGGSGPGSSSHPTRERDRDRDRDLTPSRRTSEVPVHQHQQQQTPRPRPSPLPPPMSMGDAPTITFEPSSDDVRVTQKFRPNFADSIDTATVAISGPSPQQQQQQSVRFSETPLRGPSEAPARSPVAGIVIIRPIDARHFLADAIARRLSGALCFEHDRVVRRLVLRDGDLVTAASGADRESLVCFLGARGELPRDEVDRLAGKVPPYGRHAGAALVAHGWLRQDQLWVVLRAHAEWIATGVLRIGGGTAQLEAEPPGRLRSEPSVFAATTGAEMFVELVRRAVSPQEALEALGGESARIGDGHAQSLLSECALPPAELELIGRFARGASVGDVLARAADPEIASVLHALHLLGVLDVLPSSDPSLLANAVGTDAGGGASSADKGGAGGGVPSTARGANASSIDAEREREAALLDEEAVRARIRARLELVEEGDYFSVLGVSRDATSYEVRRAFIELRRAFEPSRILTPRLAELASDVRKIVIVLEEAYEILRDVARRERYRRAIDSKNAS